MAMTVIKKRILGAFAGFVGLLAMIVIIVVAPRPYAHGYDQAILATLTYTIDKDDTVYLGEKTIQPLFFQAVLKNSFPRYPELDQFRLTFHREAVPQLDIGKQCIRVSDEKIDELQEKGLDEHQVIIQISPIVKFANGDIAIIVDTWWGNLGADVRICILERRGDSWVVKDVPFVMES